MTRKEYIYILFDDIGYSSAQRKQFLQDHTQGMASFVDELDGYEMSEVIDKLKEMKEWRGRRFKKVEGEEE